MLKISCPDGELKYPKSVLQASLYIKNSLLETVVMRSITKGATHTFFWGVFSSR